MLSEKGGEPRFLNNKTKVVKISERKLVDVYH